MREGGGGNFYGDQILPKIAELRAERGLATFVLQRRFFPEPHPLLVLANDGTAQTCSVLDEIGFYHCRVEVTRGDAHEGAAEPEEVEVLCEQDLGYVIRSKNEHSTEAAIAYGGAIGSILLSD